MTSEMAVVPGIYMGGLRSDLDPGILEKRICVLLWKCKAQIPIENIHLGKKRKNRSTLFALIDLPDMTTSKKLLSQLSPQGNNDISSVFDLRTITFQPSDFKAAPRYASSNCSTGAGSTLPGAQREQQTTEKSGAAGTMPRGLDRFYRLGEVVGRESRHSEFKQGGIAHKDRSWLPETVGRYVCGFLNSGEGGTLYIGVDDDGRVSGFSCPHDKEDNYRLLIDEALKSIHPAVFTDSYEVRFVPVMERNGVLSESLRVLEIEVRGGKRLKQLYFWKGKEAFMRRDGSLQGPMTPPQVQEWTRKQVEREQSGTLLKSQLREMTTQLRIEREKNADMQQQLTDLEVQSKQKKKRTKACLIM